MAGQISIPATYMRGGTSKGVFFYNQELPESAQQPGSVRDNILLRVIGSPDLYKKQIDGMGGATSSTSKTVILDKATDGKHHVNYLFGQVNIDKPIVDWSGNCGNLSAAVAAFAIHKGLIDDSELVKDGLMTVRIWQQNINKTIIATVPMEGGEVVETGDFELDGVTFASSEIELSFVAPVEPTEAVFPTGKQCQVLAIDGLEPLDVTMINAGIPTVFVKAEQLGYSGTELQSDINSDEIALALFEKIRAHAAVEMGLNDNLEQAAVRQHTPKIAMVAQSQDYVSSSGKQVKAEQIDLSVRALSMGQLHHAMMGTAAVAIAAAASIPGTIVSNLVNGDGQRICFGHPSGSLAVGAESIQNQQGNWQINHVTMSRSARIIMDGSVRVPKQTLMG